MHRAFFSSSFHSEDCFGFQDLSEVYSIGVNSSRKPLASADVFFF